jgi:hypothetical protein
MRLDSEESFLTSAYSKEKLLPTNALTMYFSENDAESKIVPYDLYYTYLPNT